MNPQNLQPQEEKDLIWSEPRTAEELIKELDKNYIIPYHLLDWEG
jgi:hypothetical protein